MSKFDSHGLYRKHLRHHCLPLILLAFFGLLFAQIVGAQPLISNVIVETYYISDANDSTDTDGGTLQEGSVTYRVFVELTEGSRLVELFGNANHTFFIRSTSPFFNNEDRGQTYGFDIRDNRLNENTVALDSWLSLGQASRTRLGVLKVEDTDGSVVGGANNDGGSAAIEGGLLSNTDPEAGIPLTEADGMLPWPEPGFAGFTYNQFFDNPSSVFGTETVSNNFESNNMRLNTPSGIQGPTSSNRVLVAQLTAGDTLEFEINVVVQDASGNTVRYVARDADGSQNEVVSPYLKYPPECGCTDPNFIEYSAAAPCDDGSCATPAILGCGDPEACNYNPSVNLNIPQLCCYSVTMCNGLDWTIICPSLDARDEEAPSWKVYPNPVAEYVVIEHPSTLQSEVRVQLHSLDGKMLFATTLAAGAGPMTRLDLGDVPRGMYMLSISESNATIFNTKLVKID